MAAGIKPFSIPAPGFLGLNLQDPPSVIDVGYSLEASNCVIDSSGRIGSRKGWTAINTTNIDLSTSNITCIGEVVELDGTTTIVAAGGGFLFTLSGPTLTTLTYGGTGVAPTISANNWQFCQLAGVGIFWQRGYDPLIYDPGVSTTTFRRLSEKAGYAGTVPLANTALSAYGRIWCADTSTDKNTVTWSTTLSPHIWTGGTSGSLDVRNVWPRGGEDIVTLAAHNNFLIIFGRTQALIYSGATDPSTMILSDTLESIGCIARDSVQDTGDDTVFLSHSGIRSLARTIQEKSAPVHDLSFNVRDHLQGDIAQETLADVKSIYSPIHAFYLISLPAVSEVYCLDVRRPNEPARVTTWNNINPKCFYLSGDGTLYLGQPGYVAKYSGYLDNTSSYRMSYKTPWIDFGDQIQTSILKKIILTVIGGNNQDVVFKTAFDYDTTNNSEILTITGKTSVSEWGIMEWGLGEWGDQANIVRLISNLGGSGTMVQLGFEADINGAAISFQKVEIYTKRGRLA